MSGDLFTIKDFRSFATSKAVKLRDFLNGLIGSSATSPLGAGEDDWASLFSTNGAATVAAEAGRPLVMGTGPYRADTSPSSPDRLHLVCEPGVTIASSLEAAGGYPGNYVFYFDTGTPLQGGTLAATPAVGSTTLSVSTTNKPARGHFLQITHGLSAALFEVLESDSVSSPWTVTIDRPTNLPWESGDLVAEYTSRPSDCRLDMGGAVITGGGNQYVQAFRSERVHVSGMRTTDANEDHVNPIGFDVACRQCVAEDCDLDISGSTEALGVYAQSNEETTFRRVFVRSDGNGIGHILLDCVRSRIDDCHASGCEYGASLSSFGEANGDDSLGCFECVISGGSATACGIGGLVAHVGPATNCSLVDFHAVGCTVGLYVGAGSVGGNVVRSSARACDTGLKVETGAVGTSVRDVSLSGSTTTTFHSLADVDVDGLTATGNHALGILKFEGTGTWRLGAVDITQSFVTGFGIYVVGAGRLEIDGCTISGSNEAGLVIDAAATVTVRNLRAVDSNQGIYAAAGATVVLGDGVDLSGCDVGSWFTGAGKVIGHFSGVSAIAMTNADKTAIWSEFAAAVLIVSGTLGGVGRSLVLPKYQIPQHIVNNADQPVTVKGSSGTGVTINPAAAATVVFDGTNYVEIP